MAPDLVTRDALVDTVAVDRPQTRYAKSGDVSIAFQVIGDGPFDLVFAPGFVSNVEYGWEEPTLEKFYRRLASNWTYQTAPGRTAGTVETNDFDFGVTS